MPTAAERVRLGVLLPTAAPEQRLSAQAGRGMAEQAVSSFFRLAVTIARHTNPTTPMNKVGAPTPAITAMSAPTV